MLVGLPLVDAETGLLSLRICDAHTAPEEGLVWRVSGVLLYYLLEVAHSSEVFEKLLVISEDGTS